MSEQFISLCMIVKNEGKNLARCLESVRGVVDEIVVLDTGSEDNTVSVAESFGAKIFHMPWPGDFSAARNESLKHACGTWILYLDADEALDPNGYPDCIRKAASDPEVTAWSVPIKSYKWESAAYSVTTNIRLFRNLPEIRFENEVHERIEPALARIGAKISVAPFSIDHFGGAQAPGVMKEKLIRNLLLSQMHLERAPDDPYCLYYIGATLLSLEKTAESREYFQRALAAKDLPLFLEAMTCNLLSFLELRDGRLNESLALAQRSIGLVPLQNTAYMVGGIALFRKMEFGAALPLLMRSHKFLKLSPDRRQTNLSQEHAFIDDLESSRLLGICFSETDQPSEAIEHFRRFLEQGGRDPDVVRRMGVCCVNAGEFAPGLKYLMKAETLGISSSELALPMAFACLKLEDFNRAELFLEKADEHSPLDRDKINQMKDILRSERRGRLPKHRIDGSIPRVSLCMIAKDEEKRLAGCLESVKGLVDEIIVVDTGSSDQTKEIAQSFGARVYSFPWTEDFAEARNESLRRATGNWIIFLDADEKLNPGGAGDCLRKAASTPGVDAFAVPVINSGSKGKAVSTIGRALRFFRNLTGIQFSGRVHESVDRFLVQSGARVDHADFEIEHLGYSLEPEIVRRKYERNLALLKKELEENPEDGNAMYHIGLTCMALEREAEAREAFDLALQAKGLTPCLKAMVLNMKSYHHLRAGESDESLEAACRSLSAVPVQNTARLLKGLSLFRKQAYGEALPLLLDAYRFDSLPPRERKSDISFEDSIDKIDLVNIVGVCLAETGKFAEAVPFLKLAAHQKPGAAVFERLGVCLLNSGTFSEALKYLRKARADAPEPNSMDLPLSFACLKTGDFEGAAEYFRSAEPRDEGELSVAFQLIQAMAAENDFRPYLPGCIKSKLENFCRAFPEQFLKFLSDIQCAESLHQTSQPMEA